MIHGKNLVVFDVRGFVDSDKLKNINSIWLRIYDNNMESDSVDIALGDFKVFSNYESFYRYVMTTDYKINPQ